MKLDEQVLQVLHTIGPATSLEITRRVNGADSLIVSAVLVDAASQKRIMQSRRRFGSSRLYYFPEQMNSMQKRVSNELQPEEKELLQGLMNENIVGEHELNPQAIEMLRNLEDLVGIFSVEYQERMVKFWYAPSLKEEKAKEMATTKLLNAFGTGTDEVTSTELEVTPEPMVSQPPNTPNVKLEVKPEPKEVTPEPKPEVKETKPEPKEVTPEPKEVTPEPKETKPEPEKEEKKPEKEEKKPEKEKTKEELIEEERDRIRHELLAEMHGSFRDNVLHWLEKQEIDVTEETVLKEGQEVQLEVHVPTKLGNQTYMVRVFDYPKKAASQNDVATVGMEAVSKRTPAIIISRTGFAKNAMKYWKKELEDLVTLISNEDLE